MTQSPPSEKMAQWDVSYLKPGTMVVRIEDAQAEIAKRDAEIERLKAEIERMTPKFVAYDYLETPERADRAEAKLAKAVEALLDASLTRWNENDRPYQLRARIDVMASNAELALTALSSIKEGE